jgi:hypothetical protein
MSIHGAAFTIVKTLLEIPLNMRSNSSINVEESRCACLKMLACLDFRSD